MRTQFELRTVLRTIYAAIENGEVVVGPSYIAESLGVSKSTAQKILKGISECGLGNYVTKKGLVLNETGMREAEKAMRRHRLIECMLEDMGVRDVCSEAGRIEMVAGEELMMALERKYGDRKTCPCGNRIPET